MVVIIGYSFAVDIEQPVIQHQPSVQTVCYIDEPILFSTALPSLVAAIGLQSLAMDQYC